MAAIDGDRFGGWCKRERASHVSIYGVYSLFMEDAKGDDFACMRRACLILGSIANGRCGNWVVSYFENNSFTGTR
jgi:hypothetical protein